MEVLLKVSEAFTKDVGRGIVRINLNDMRMLKVQIGDIIEIEGKSKAIAKVMPSTDKDMANKTILMDGILRKNAGVSLGENVTVRKIEYTAAEKIVLCPINTSLVKRNEEDIRYLSRILEGMPVLKGNIVRINLIGSLTQEFLVKDVNPDRAAVVYHGTVIKLVGEGESENTSGRISYEDIGGLDREIEKIREMIELPLKYPEIFDRLGIQPPKGVLLLGPPGTGKTLIARAVASETDAFFTCINGPEIINKFYGESEARLREIFEKANKNSPSIIFIDEIDAIAPKREVVTGEVEKRVVAQLLALMDGIKSRGKVIVIGATNIPNSLDPALRRPGRFDREIEISVPNKKGRTEILQIHTRGMPLGPDVNLEAIADITGGYVGADLEALCREAAMSALRRIFHKIDFRLKYIPYEVLLEVIVTMNDFNEALKIIGPSATREFLIEVPNVKWSDIGGLEIIKQKVKETIEWPIKYSDFYEELRFTPPKGILFYGMPGTGKTLVAKAIANETKANFILVKGPEIISKWIGESERAIREIFKKAKRSAPCILFFDEVDALISKRGSNNSQVTDRIISQILTELDGLEELKGVIVIAATNRIEDIDPAVLRPGRFDLLLELPLPDREARKEIFKIHTNENYLGTDVDLDVLAGLTEGMSGAHINNICRRALSAAIKEFVSVYGGKLNNKLNFKIKQKHFLNSIEEISVERC